MRRLVLPALLALGLGGCATPPADLGGSGHAMPTGVPSVTAPAGDPALSAGERFETVGISQPYLPVAPRKGSTDDYRCFLLDPGFTVDSLITGVLVQPGTPGMVHHVILYRVDPADTAKAELHDRSTPGQGWSCYGGSGVRPVATDLDSSDWIAAWAPGGGEKVLGKDIGIPLAKGSRIVMQVHYNFRTTRTEDRTAARLRVAKDDGTRKALRTMLMPAPVELPCRTGTAGLCDRTTAVADLKARYGRAGNTADLLHLLCGPSKPGPTQSCARPVRQAATVRAVAGHMHLLGRSITIDLNQGKPGARRLLDIPAWNFDDQGATPLSTPVRIKPGDTLTVTCTHDVSLRDRLPAFEGTTERYIAWGEGTTDEMCLGIVLLTRP